MINLFFLEYFLVALPMGFILNVGKRGLERGPIINLSRISLARRESTDSGSDVADCRLRQVYEESGRICTPGWKQFLKLVRRKVTNFGLGDPVLTHTHKAVLTGL